MKAPASVISHRLMYFFGPAARFAGGFIGLVGIAVLLWGGWAGLILVVFGLGLISAQSGMELYPDECRFRLYYNVFWLFKMGQKRDLTPYNRLMVMPWRGSHVVYSRSNRRVEHPESKYVVYALHQNRNEKIPLYIADEQEAALQKLKEIKSAIPLNWLD
jgi:hypothetical protein